MIFEVFFLSLVSVMLFGTLESYGRLQKINRYLEIGKPYEFLSAIEKELERGHRPPVRELLKLNRSAGLVYIGKFEDALRSLQEVDLQQLGSGWFGRRRKFTEALYYNNLLYTLLCARHYQEAVDLWSLHAEKLVPRTGHSLLDHCLKGTAATFQYHCGDVAQARATLERLLQEPDIPQLYKAHRLYYLGRIDLNEGRFAQGMQNIEEAARLAPGGFLQEEPKRLALGEERIPPPGAGRA